ncbi:protein kinase [Pendulispora albinea]|uniref:Protein kinase n=2 Tax=Pendulispora albinea TaxID=2741071 RepID=A0ABZ2MBV8_9BACT
MGSVWEAMHLGLDVPCAMKFIDGNAQDREIANHRFEREAKTAAQIRSRHVVQILDHGVWEGVPYIAMELLRGESLRARLVRMLVLSPPEVLRIVRHVGRGLRKAHERGIVHRDLKPDNIFLTHDDDLTQGQGAEIAKVLDFGVAKWTSHDQIMASHTRSGDLLGTPVYMSPEQIRGSRDVDTRSDLWSLAVIVFRCLTGRLPFVAESFGNLVLEICTKPLLVPSEMAAVPPGFDAWWQKAAARDPEDRFQTERELVLALERVLNEAAADEASVLHVVSGPASPSIPDVPPEGQAALEAAPTERDRPAGPLDPIGAMEPTRHVHPNPHVDSVARMEPPEPSVHGISLGARERRHGRSWIVGAVSAAVALTACTWVLLAFVKAPKETAAPAASENVPSAETAAPIAVPASAAAVVSAAPESPPAPAPVEPAAPVVNGAPATNAAPVANGAPATNAAPVANVAPVVNGAPATNTAPVANGAPATNTAPVANGAPATNTAPAANGAPATNTAPANAVPASASAPSSRRANRVKVSDTVTTSLGRTGL